MTPSLHSRWAPAHSPVVGAECTTDSVAFLYFPAPDEDFGVALTS